MSIKQNKTKNVRYMSRFAMLTALQYQKREWLEAGICYTRKNNSKQQQGKIVHKTAQNENIGKFYMGFAFLSAFQ